MSESKNTTIQVKDNNQIQFYLSNAMKLGAAGILLYKFIRNYKYGKLWFQTKIPSTIHGIFNMELSKKAPNFFPIYGNGQVLYEFKDQKDLCDPLFGVKPFESNVPMNVVGFYRRMEIYNSQKSSENWVNADLHNGSQIKERNRFFSDQICRLNGYEISKALMLRLAENEVKHSKKVELKNTEIVEFNGKDNSQNDKLFLGLDIKELNKKLFSDQQKQRFYRCLDNHIYVTQKQDLLFLDGDLKITFHEFNKRGEVTVLGIHNDNVVEPFCLSNPSSGDTHLKIEMRREYHTSRYDEICLIYERHLGIDDMKKYFKSSILHNSNLNFTFLYFFVFFFYSFSGFFLSSLDDDDLKQMAKNSIKEGDQTSINIENPLKQQNPSMSQIILWSIFVQCTRSFPYYSTILMIPFGYYTCKEIIQLYRFQAIWDEEIESYKSKMNENLQKKLIHQEENSISNVS